MILRLYMFACLLVTMTAFSGTVSASGLHSVWGELLSVHVRDGRVDYQGFKRDEDKLDSYLAQLDRTNPDALDTGERLALYINSYNAYTVKLILNKFRDGRPVDSIRDIGGFFSGPWSIKFARVGGRTLTLDNIEHDIIRPGFGEPRVHFAVNCASKSCPPLIPEAYTGPRLEDQLQANTIAFLNNRKFNYISGNTLYVSKIFKWFSEDFGDDIPGFVRQYARGELLEKLQAAGRDIQVRYLDYDWSLNSI